MPLPPLAVSSTNPLGATASFHHIPKAAALGVWPTASCPFITVYRDRMQYLLPSVFSMRRSFRRPQNVVSSLSPSHALRASRIALSLATSDATLAFPIAGTSWQSFSALVFGTVPSPV